MEHSVHLNARKSQVVGARTVLANLDDPEVAESVEAVLRVVVSVDLERAATTGAGKLLDDLLVRGIELVVAREELPPVKHDAVRVKVVVRGLELPVLNHVRGRVAVADRVAHRRKQSELKQIHAHVRQVLVVGPAVDGLAADDVLDTATSNGRRKCPQLAGGVGVLPHASQAVGADEVEQAIFIEVVLIDKLAVLTHVVLTQLVHWTVLGWHRKIVLRRETVIALVEVLSKRAVSLLTCGKVRTRLKLLKETSSVR